LSSPFSSLVSSKSGAQERCSIQDLRGFAQLLYRGHECFEPLTLFLAQGSLVFPPPTLLSILQGCEVPEDATAYVLPHHSAVYLLASRVVEAASISLFPSHIDRSVTKAVQLARGNTTVDEPEHPPFLAVARSCCRSRGGRLLGIWARTRAPASEPQGVSRWRTSTLRGFLYCYRRVPALLASCSWLFYSFSTQQSQTLVSASTDTRLSSTTPMFVAASRPCPPPPV
jgi:hypothetical protein